MTYRNNIVTSNTCERSNKYSGYFDMKYVNLFINTKLYENQYKIKINLQGFEMKPQISKYFVKIKIRK